MEFTCFMSFALAQAVAASKRGEIPVGAVVVKSGIVIAQAGNETRGTCDPTAHAEILAMRRACTVLKAERLTGCDLYVTLEPCPMCATAISYARISRIYCAAMDPKSGGIWVYDNPACHHKPDIYTGIKERASQKLLTKFFTALRSNL